MTMPGFTAEASLRQDTGEGYQRRAHSAQKGRPALIGAQLGIGPGNGVYYPPGDDDCYCCIAWTRCPCALGLD
jgi:hypothetical protein